MFFRSRGELRADRAYLRFILGLADRFDELILFGRVHPDEQHKPYLITPRPRVRHVELPYYARASDLRAVAGALTESRRIFRAELQHLDGVWLCGPNPLALEFARIALHRRVPVSLGIRQDFPSYVRNRFPRNRLAFFAGEALELSFRLLALRCPTVTVGPELARNFAHGRAPVLSIAISQITAGDIVDPETAIARNWSHERRLLSVGRLDPEKNPLLLAETLALLTASDPRWRLDVVGEGPEREALARRADELGVGQSLRLSGYVEAGDRLWGKYRDSHAFLHVSLTEGVPSVIFEAQAAGLPVVATDVGGVGSAVKHESTGLLVPPRDAGRAASALTRLANEPDLRRRLVTASSLEVKQHTRDAELDRLAAFLTTHATSRGSR